MHESFVLPSFAKVNWTLRVLGKRRDGFHEILTVFQTVSLVDEIEFSDGNGFTLSCDISGVPVDEKNLIERAAILLSKRDGITADARIHLAKRIPSPGGLGGGSSNGAAALVGLRRLWGIEVSDDELCEIAAEIGSDVPFFLNGGTAIGTGRGELIEPIDDIVEPYLLIVTPAFSVSTAEAFSKLNAPTLTSVDSDRILRVCRAEAVSFDPRLSVLKNDFEASVFDAFPEVGRVKKTLLGLGAVNAAMSGSGASVFGIFDNTETRQAAEKALDKESTWRRFAVSTVSRSEYRRALGL